MYKLFNQYKRESTDAKGHRIYYDTEDLSYVSSTSLLSTYEPKDGLELWRQRIGLAEAAEITQKAIERGKKAHTTIENFIEGIEAESDDSYGKVAIESFFRHVDIKYVEEPVFFKSGNARYAGRFDQMVNVPTNTFQILKSYDFIEGTCLVDLKTKDKLPRYDKADFLIKNCMQLASYFNAINSSGINEHISGAIIVYATKKNSRILYLDTEKLIFYWNCFKQLLLDYYNLKPLKYTWQDFVDKANLSFDREHSCFVTYKPDVIHLAAFR